MSNNSNRARQFFSAMESLEERVLFDGMPDGDLSFLLPGSEQPVPAQVQLNADADSTGPRELVLIDAAVEDPQTLLQSILESNPHTAFEVRILDADRNGVAQITSLLSESTVDYEAVHILSHGNQGEVHLGSGVLTNDNVHDHVDELAMWSDSLSGGADLLFYGCDLAGNSDGQSLLETIQATTGADVAASDDITGNAARAGDWELEFIRGDVQTESLAAHNWQGILAVEATDGIVTIQDAENSTAGTITLTNNGAPEVVTVLNTPSRVGQMLERVWQFNETADTGSATYVFDVSGIAGINGLIASDFGLIVSDQPDLADGPNTTTLVASGYDAANGLVFFHQVDLDSGDFFGLATEVVQDNFSINPTATGLEDTPIDLGLQLSDSLLIGGVLQDIIGTDGGFRASTAGTTSTDFFIPAGTTGIRITGFSTRDIGTGASDEFNDDYQFLNASIDLATETSNGYIGHIVDQGPNRSDQFGWEDAPLGSSVLTGGGTVTGDADDNIDPTFEIVDGVLRITENHQLQTAYHIEYLTNATSSSEFIRTESAVLESGVQSLANLTIPAGTDFLVVNINDAAAGSNFAVEYKGNSRVYIDLATLQASGVVAAQQGETDDRVVSYAFEDYDVSSAAIGSILSAAGTVVGDSGDASSLASVINDNQIYIDGSGNLVIDRNDDFAGEFNSLITVEYYDRRDAGSSAEQVGVSTDYGLFDSDPSNPTSTLEFDIPENATLGILNLTQNGVAGSDTNENSGAAFAVIDLVNGTSSGSIYFVRASSVVDLVGWDSTDFGTAFFDDPNSISNHNTLNQFNDPFAGTATFNLINGGTTLELAVNSNGGGAQSFRDYFAGGQVEWFGAAPFEISGFTNGGTFSQGSLNPVTGSWELTIADAQAGLAYIPPTHVSGTIPVDVALRIGDETEVTSVTVQAVIDPISFMAPDVCGHEDTDISILDAVTPVFVDQDGSETVTSQVLSNVPIGHTLTDGTNVFVSSAGNQSVDITAWDFTSITYRANPNESGTFTITMDVDWQDVGGGVTDTDSLQTTFDVVVKPQNDLPVAVNDFYTVLGNNTLTVNAANGVLNNDSDVDGDTLMVTGVVSGPTVGMVVLNADGSFSYTPPTGFSGTASFEYEVSDGNGGVTTATAFIDVSEPVTGPLDAMDDMVTTNEETLINIDVMANDDLPTTGAFNIQSTTPPSNGSITVLPDGTIDYTPNPDFFGMDTFTYTLADASGRTSTATVTVTVVNIQDPPVANADSGSTQEDTTLPNIDILSNDSDPDNDMLTVTMATAPNGTVVINPDGTIDYTPNPGFNGTDIVTYTISDGNGGFATSTVQINVAPVADPPTSADNTVALDEDTSYTFAVSDFAFADQDVGDSLVAVRIDTAPTDGTLLLNGNPIMPGDIVSLGDINAGRLIFVPDPDENGTGYATFDFSVSDGVQFQTAPNTMTIDVNPLQDPPVATDNAITVAEESTGTPLGLAPPTDLDGDVLSATVTGLPILGTLFLADGTTPVNVGDMLTIAQLTGLVYDAPADYDGVADPGDFTYDVTDGVATDSGVVDITITPVNDPPEICLGDHSATNLTFVDDRAGFNGSLIGNVGSTIIDDMGAFAMDPATGSFASVSRSGLINGVAFGYTIYDIDFSNTPTGTLTPGVVGGDIFDLDNISVEAPAAQGGAVGSGSWGVDSVTGNNSTRNALLFDFTTTPGGLGIGHFGAEFHDLENDPAFTSAEYRVYRGGVLIDSGIIDFGPGNNGNNESHFFGYAAGSEAGFFDQIAIVVGDDAPGGGLADRLAADRFTFGTAFAGECPEDHADTFVEGTAGVGLVDPYVSLTDVDDTTFPSFQIDVDASTIVDPGQEFLTIGGVDFQLDAPTSSTTPVSVGGIGYDVSFDAATGQLDFVRTDGMEMSAAEIEAILAGTTYRNDSVLPTESDRIFDISVNDGDDNSNIATSTISVVRDAESVQFSLTGDMMVIDGNNASYTVELSGPIRNGEIATVDIGLADVDTNSGDYASFSAAVAAAVAAYAGPGGLSWDGTTLTFTSDGTGAMAPLVISLATTPDGVFEGDEDLIVSLTNPGSTTGEDVTLAAADSVTTTIKDDTPPPTLMISDGMATEGDPAVFELTFDVASFEDITFDLAAATGSATAVTDFETTSFEFFDGTTWVAAAGGTQVTIPAGQTSLMVRIDTVQDGDVEPDETFTLSATVVSGTVTSASDTGTGTIINDDVALISVDDVVVDEDNGTLTFTISVDQPPAGTVSVDFATASGTATSGVDFVAANGTATFAPGVQTQTVTVAITDDNIFEGPHTFDLNLSNASGGTIVDGTGVGTIVDDGTGPNGSDDDRPVISIDDITTFEDVDPFAVFTISLSNPSVEDTVLGLTLANVTAVGGLDYGPGLEFFDGTVWQPVTGNITILAGDTSIQVRTAINDDPIADSGETFTLTATQVSGTTANSGDTGTATIFDDPVPDPTLVSITGPGSVTEGNSATYDIEIDNVPLTDVTVTFTYSGTASGGTDYSGVASVTILAGSTLATVTIPTIDDTLGEPIENFTITIDSVTGGSLESVLIDPVNFEVTTDIIDDDAPKIAVNDVIVTEGFDAFAEFTVELSNPTFEDIDFAISATGVTANGETVDFGILGLDELEVFDGTNFVPATSATFVPGATTILLRTPIVDDVLAEPVETFTVTVTVTGGTTCNAFDTGTGTIQDDTSDPETVLVSLTGPPSVVEGATTTPYTLTLTDPSGLPINAAEDITVTLAYTGVAADGSDFSAVATVVIPQGSGTGTFTLPTVNDSLFEGDEEIIVTIDEVTGGGFEAIAADSMANTVTTVITDDADIPTVSINNVTSIEGTDNFAVFTIELSNLTVEDIDVNLSLANGTAFGGGVDFGAVGAGNLQVFDGTTWADATTATIAAGEMHIQVRTPIIDDNIDEPNENYSLTVDVTAGTTTNIQVVGNGTIIDNDPAPDVTIGDAVATEGDQLVFAVTLSNPSSQPIVLNFAATDNSTSGAADFSQMFEFSTDGGVTWIAATGGSEVTIPANSNGVLVRTLTTEDTTLETTETMQLSIASVVSGLVGNTTDTGTGTIIDDDTALVSILANDPIAGEPNDDGQFTVSLTNPSDSPTTIAYTVTGSANSGIDFAALSGTITLPAGITSGIIDLAVIDDLIVEGDEDVTITLTSIVSGDADISIDTANDSDTVIIADDDAAQWQLTGAASVNEGAIATYQVELNGTLQGGESASVELAITDGTTTPADHASFDAAVAAAVATYSGPGSLVWDGTNLTFTSDGTGEMAPLVIELLAVNDSIVEGVEQYNVSIGNATSTTGIAVSIDPADFSVDTEIQDTIDAVGTALDKASFSLTGATSVGESQTTDYTITIDATLQAGEDASIDIVLTNGDTTAGDITALDGAVAAAVAAYNSSAQPGSVAWDGTTLTFTSDGTGPMGDLIVQIEATADGFLEGPEDYTLSITNPASTTGAAVCVDAAMSSVTTTIQPDVTAAVWSIGVDNAGDEGATVQYTVSLSEAFGAGESATVDIGLNDVDTNSSDYASFVAAVNAAVAGYAGPGTLTFDGTTLTYTAVADGDLMTDLVIDLMLTDDAIAEGPETFTVDLDNPSGPTGINVAVDAMADSVTTTINDTMGVAGAADEVVWSITGPTVGPEGTTVQYTLGLSGALGAGESVSVFVNLNDIDTNSSDYGSFSAAVTAAAATDPNVTFDVVTGELTYTAPADGAMLTPLLIDLGLNTDTIVEGDEDFEIALTGASSLTGVAVSIDSASQLVTTTITDTTAPLEWRINGPAFEDEGGTAQYLILLDGSLEAGETASVEINLNDLTTNSSDYANILTAVSAAVASDPNVSFDPTTGVLTYTAPADGATLAPIIVDLGISDDILIEGSEQFEIVLSNPGSTTGAAVQVSSTADSVTTTINDTQGLGGVADGPAEWSIIGDTSVNEGATAGYRIILSGAFGENESVSVDLGLSDVDTTSADYANFVSAVNAAVTSYSGPGTVAFDGTTLTFTAAFDGDSLDDLLIDLSTVNDTIVEGSEDYTIALSNAATTTAANVAIDTAAQSVTTTIVDNDTAIWSLIGDSTVAEGSDAKYRLALTGTLQSGETATVDLTVGDVDTNSTDYANFVVAVNVAISNYSGPGTLAFDGTTLTFTSDGNPMGELCVELRAINDAFVEGDEDYTVSIATPGSSTGSDVMIGGAASVTTTITDSDVAVWSITGDATVGEGSDAKYTLALTGTLQSGETATVDLFVDDVDTNSTDYANFVVAVNTAISNYSGPGTLALDGTTLTFTSDGSPMGELCVELRAINDAFVEGDEDYTVSIATPGSSTGSDVMIGGAASVTTTITDSDVAVWSITGDATVGEGANATYVVALSGILQAGETATIELGLANVGTNSADYANFVAAVNNAVSTRPDLTFDGTTLTYTGDGNLMDDLNIELGAVDDVLVEGDEDYTVSIATPGSTTGSDVVIGGTTTVTTTIIDNDVAVWSITGDATIGEGATASYTLSRTGTLQFGETTTIDLGLSNVDTNSADYTNFVAAVNVALAGRPDLIFDGMTLTHTSNGSPFVDLIIELPTVDDVLVEGDETYSISISNPRSKTGADTMIGGSSVVSTTITDNDVAVWSITGDATVAEGAAAQYLVELDGLLQLDETATVELVLSGIDTISTDHVNLAASVSAAVAAYSGPGTLVWDGTTLTFTSDGTGAMAPLTISLGTVDDGFAEGTEDYQIALDNAGSTTGTAAIIDAMADDVVTTIDDTLGVGADDVAWAIVGDTAVDEGGTAGYIVSFATGLGAGNRVAVDLSLTDIDTDSSDYANFDAAVADAVANYNAGGNDGVLAWDGTTLTFTATMDGDSLSGLFIELDATDDPFLEGPEDYVVSLSNAASSTGVVTSIDSAQEMVVTTINDTQGDGGPVEAGPVWSLTGATSVIEGDPITYTIALTGDLQAGENATVQILPSDIDTNSSDYAIFSKAVSAAVTDYNSDPTTSGFLSWTGTSLTFTSDGRGPMDDLVVNLGTVDDALIEGDERLSVILANPASATGLSPTISMTQSAVTTTIIDNDLATWTISGDTAVDEGAVAQYTVVLIGNLQAGETATIDLDIGDIDTNSADYANFVAAVNAAIAGRSDLAFDGTTLTYKSDGDPMAALIIDLNTIDDALIESAEDFTIQISDPDSTTGASIGIAGTSSVTTTITDNDLAVWNLLGDPVVPEGGFASYTLVLTGTLQAGVTATVDLGLTNVDTTSADYANFVAAVNAAVTARSDLAFDGTTVTYTSDGTPMTNLTFDIMAIDDLIIEGNEDYMISISNSGSANCADVGLGGSTTVTTTIIDNDQATWNISGDATVTEGGTAQYTVALDGTIQDGETATIDIGLSDIDTNSADYSNFVLAINAAIAGRPELSFDGTTLTYTGDGNPLQDLVIELPINDDPLVEGDEQYGLNLSNPTSSTQIAPTVAASEVVTTIEDNDVAIWSISGGSTVDEGDNANFTISLDGAFQAGEVVFVQLDLTDIDTTSSDYGDWLAAVSNAVASNPALSFDPTTATLTFTAPFNGAAMSDLVIEIPTVLDSLIEGDEQFSLELTTSGSATGASSSINPNAAEATTTIVEELVNAELGIAKSVIGEPELFFNGNFELTFRIQVQNIGDVDLINLSLIDDLASQLGPAFGGINNLTLTSSVSDPNSSIAINNNWNGGSIVELLDPSTNNRLAVGDSFIIEFAAEVNPRLANGPLSNQASGSGTAVDANGNVLTNANGGAAVTATDDSDDGLDPQSENGNADLDGVFGNDPTLIDFVEIDPTGYFYDASTGEILTGGSITVQGPTAGSVILTDAGADGSYQFFGTESGVYTITVTPPPGFTLNLDTLQSGAFDPTGSGSPVLLGADEAGSTGFLSSPTQTQYFLQFELEAGDPIVLNNNLPFDGEEITDETDLTTGNPPQFPGGGGGSFRPLLGPSSGGPGATFSGIRNNALSLDSQNGGGVGGYSGAAGCFACDEAAAPEYLQHSETPMEFQQDVPTCDEADFTNDIDTIPAAQPIAPPAIETEIINDNEMGAAEAQETDGSDIAQTELEVTSAPDADQSESEQTADSEHKVRPEFKHKLLKSKPTLLKRMQYWLTSYSETN